MCRADDLLALSPPKRSLSRVRSDVAMTSSTRLSGSEVFLVDAVIWGRP